MRWVRVDAGFPSHPKTLTVGPVGAWVYLRGLCYAAHQGTEGFLPIAVMDELLWGLDKLAVVTDSRARGKIRRTVVASEIDWPGRLVAAHLWEDVPGGYQIHNYRERQPSNEYFEQLSTTRAEVGRLGGLKSGETRRVKQRSKIEANGLANSQANASEATKQNRSTIRNETKQALVCFSPNDPEHDDAPVATPGLGGPGSTVFARVNGHSAERGDYLTALERIHAKLAAQRPEGT